LHSPETSKAIDEEVRRIVDECYAQASKLLEDNVDKLHTMADALMEFETLSSEQLDDIMAGAKPRHPSDPPSSSGSSSSPKGETPIGGPAEES
ncbi:MAG: ATP-dependent metalloprotease, partial [Pseudomonadota bacterium]|nr:ATP-dependent metalloprotease [Pseudomonadota bacterium]